jgi:hypothetical protein
MKNLLKTILLCFGLLLSLALQAQVNKTDSTSVDISEKTRKKAVVDKQNLLKKQAGLASVRGEEVDDLEAPLSINEGTLLGIGGYKMKDTYLSPERYGGLGYRFVNERMRLTKMANYRVSKQNRVNVDFSSAINGAENANFLSAFVDYSLGYHYRFLPDPFLKIMIGGSAQGMLGMVYNTRNGNNPITMHTDIDLNFSMIAIYEFRLKKQKFALRYQFETPFAGVLFSPMYNQSYYEIFSLGNTSGILNFNSFHNKFAMRNFLTLDFSVGNTTIRTGYFGNFYATKINKLDRQIISHNFLLGIVKELVMIKGSDMKKRNEYNSAFY